MKKLNLLFGLLLILSSCANKDYEYIEIVEEQSVFGDIDKKEKESKTIKAKNDSIAYLEAYKNFCISLKVNRDMKESIGEIYSTPKDFKLMNEQGIDIAKSVTFQDKETLEKDIENKIFSMPNTLQESKDKSEKEKIKTFKETGQSDSSKIKELDKYFIEKKDKFDPDQMVWHKPKSAPKYLNRNGIYCYFQSNQGMPSNLRFKTQYHSDNWLFIRKVQFLIDGKAYEYIPSNVETNHGGGRIWEWFDEPVKSTDIELLEALANAKSAEMKLIGRQYHNIKNITSAQIKDIKRTLELYKAMGGQY